MSIQIQPATDKTVRVIIHSYNSHASADRGYGFNFGVEWHPAVGSTQPGPGIFWSSRTSPINQHHIAQRYEAILRDAARQGKTVELWNSTGFGTDPIADLHDASLWQSDEAKRRNLVRSLDTVSDLRWLVPAPSEEYRAAHEAFVASLRAELAGVEAKIAAEEDFYKTAAELLTEIIAEEAEAAL